MRSSQYRTIATPDNKPMGAAVLAYMNKEGKL
jgi:hypothetical protein